MQGRKVAKETTQHSSCLKGTRLLPVSLSTSPVQHRSPLLLSVFLPHRWQRPWPGGSPRPHVLRGQPWSEPLQACSSAQTCSHSHPNPGGVSHPCVGESWGPVGPEHGAASAEDVDPEESRLLISTAHRTTGFLPLTVVYVTQNPGISSTTNVPPRTPT